jgi:hypothetical protein
MAGAFEQASYAGRVTVRAGDLMVQPTLDCHANGLPSRHARAAAAVGWNERGTHVGLPVSQIKKSADPAVTRTGSLLHPRASIVAGASRDET